MKQRGIIAFVLAAVVTTGIAVTVVAQDGPQGPPPMGRGRGPGGPGGMAGPGGIGMPGLRELDLSDAQKEQIKTISQSHRDEARQVGEKVGEAQRALDQTADSGGSEGDVRAKAAALANAIADAAILRARVNAEIVNVLTAEQQQKLREFRAQMEQRMKERVGQRGPGAAGQRKRGLRG
jgi:protein CpxP